MLGAGVNILASLVLVCCCVSLLQKPHLVELGVCVDDLHVERSVCLFLPKVTDEKVLIPLIFNLFP